MENLGKRFLEAQETESGREIPIDLLMDFFSRVPATTIGRCRCVSKLWKAILGRQDFTELFMTMSWARPRLFLFTLQAQDKVFFFSSPQPQNPDDNTSLVPTRYHVDHTHSPIDFALNIDSTLGGFICRLDKGILGDIVVICNPVTGESLFLPKAESKSVKVFTRPYLGYDPIHKQFKVLCINRKFDGSLDEHRIMTLENGNHLWRAIQCIKPHRSKSNGICIDGVLYYAAGVDPKIRVTMIVCFDIRSEKFSFIELDKGSFMTSSCTLINYKGKLGALHLTLSSPKCLEFWLQEDAGWSKNIYTLPSFTIARNYVNTTGLVIVGMTDSGEVVLSPFVISDPFYIYYYNLRSNGFTRAQIQGFELFKRYIIYIFIDYSENLKNVLKLVTIF